jgi:hypothetical protein
LSARQDKKNVIKYIKEFYLESGKSPSMKNIQDKCGLNPRVFYEMFKNQEEAFKLAGVPYSGEAKKKVVRANIARKHGKVGVIEYGPKQTIRVIDGGLLRSLREEKYVKKATLMMQRLSNVYMKYLRVNPGDRESITDAYDSVSSVILLWYTILQLKDREYEIVKSMKNSGDPNMVMCVRLGYDFDDLNGSHNRICGEEFKKTLQDKTSVFWDSKTEEYFWGILGEVFGEPPDFMVS